MKRSDVFGAIVVAVLAIAFVGGIFLFFWRDNGWYLIGPTLALILAAAG